MHIAYFDETGDEGYPKYSSPLFILTSFYTHHQNWKTNYQKIHEFRKTIRDNYKFPIKLEFHTRPFLTDKHPYKKFKWSKKQRRELVFLFSKMITNLEGKFINVVINKKNIMSDNDNVLEKALTYNVQRIENDLKEEDKNNKFLIISDEGRIEKMRKITRKIQIINYIPSKFEKEGYRSEIECLIEDPLSKDSKQSYFIQIVDFVSYLVHLYSVKNFLVRGKWANRVQKTLEIGDEIKLLTILKPLLNLKANPKDIFGIVHYPK